MLNQSPWKVTLVLLVCLAGLIFAFPNLFSRDTVEQWPGFLPKSQINLGLDLQGGAYLLLEVDSEAVVQERMEELTNEVRVALRGAGIGYQGLGVVRDAVTFRLTDPSQRDAAMGSSERNELEQTSSASRSLLCAAVAWTGRIS